MSLQIYSTACLLSLGGRAYDHEALEIINAWQRQTELPITFVILDTPELVNAEILGIDSRPAEYFRTIIRSFSWTNSISIVTFSELCGKDFTNGSLARVEMAASQNKRIRHLLQSQTYSSLYFYLREVGIKNQRHPTVNSLTQYLVLEIALLNYLHCKGVDLELSFHLRGSVVSELSSLGLSFPAHQHLILRNFFHGVTIENLRFYIPNTKRVVGPVTIKIHAGQILAVMGPNGSGKSSFLRALAGHAAILDGDIRLDHLSVVDFSPYSRQFSTMFQDAGLIETITAMENISLGERVAFLRNERKIDINILLNQLSISTVQKTRSGKLSGGEKQMVSFARALGSTPRLLLLDEPTAALDRLRQERFVAVLKSQVIQLKISVIVVSHDVEFVSSVANQILIFDRQGRVVEQGSVERLLKEATTLTGCDVLGFHNIFSVTEVKDQTIIDEWISINKQKLQAPQGARGFRIKSESLRCMPATNITEIVPNGEIHITGFVRSRRFYINGDFILFQPIESASIKPIMPTQSRGFWFISNATLKIESMKVTLIISISDLIWLK